MKAHRNFLEGKLTEAQKNYEQLMQEAVQRRTYAEGRVVVAIPQSLVRWIYVDLAEIARREGDWEKATFYQQNLQ